MRKPVKPLGALSLQTATPAPKPSPAMVAQGVQDEVAAREAKASGWGFVADHFSQIDTSWKGYVTLAEISRFMAARSPQKLMQAAPR